jgi:hypothetical protein
MHTGFFIHAAENDISKDKTHRGVTPQREVGNEKLVKGRLRG